MTHCYWVLLRPPTKVGQWGGGSIYIYIYIYIYIRPQFLRVLIIILRYQTPKILSTHTPSSGWKASDRAMLQELQSAASMDSPKDRKVGEVWLKNQLSYTLRVRDYCNYPMG